MEIRQAFNEVEVNQVKELLREYFAWVHDTQGFDINYQGIESELAGLPGIFSPPAGALLLVLVEGAPAGCVALKPLPDGSCEMKRMYVRPAYRGQGLGRALAERVIQEARQRGYPLMRLDTANTLTVAQSLYTSLGFKLTGPYYDVPPDISQWVLFMELPLV